MVDLSVHGNMCCLSQINKEYEYTHTCNKVQKFYGRHHDLVNRYGISVTKVLRSSS